MSKRFGFRQRVEFRGLSRWLVHSFAPTVVLPVAVVLIVTRTARVGLNLKLLGGRGEFALMAVALAAGAHASVNRSASLRQVPADDPQTLGGLTTLVLALSAVVWGFLAGESDAHSNYDASFGALIGLIVLGLTAGLSIVVAVVEARTIRDAADTIVVQVD